MVSFMEHRGEIVDIFAKDSLTMALIRRSNESEPFNDGLNSMLLDEDIYAIGDHSIDNYSSIYTHLACSSSYRKHAIKDLRGSFALAMVEEHRGSKRLTLARDIYGTRSMYYLKTDHALFFASEMKCFLAIEGFKPEINVNALNYYLTCGFTPNRETLFSGVYKVLPAEIVEFENGNFNCLKYWVPGLARWGPLDLDYWCDSIWESLLTVTKTMLPADEHKIGIALSGGLDSSLIAAALKHVGKARDIVGFSLDDGDDNKSELKIAEYISSYLGIDCHSVHVRSEQLIRDLERLQWIYDEPLIKFSFIPTYYLVDAANKYVDTLFTGDGGDEQFIGYRSDYWEDPLAIKLFSKLGDMRRPFLTTGRKLTKPIAKLTGSKTLSLATEFFTRDYASHPLWQYRIASRVFQGYFAEEELSMLMQDNSFQGVTDKIAEIITMTNSHDRIENISHAMIMSKLPDDLLRLDKSVGATGVKVRAPLLDPKMTNFILSAPIRLRYQDKTTKYLVRYLSKKHGLLPNKIVDTKIKRGLTAPLNKWLTKSPSREYFEDLIRLGINHLNINTDYVKCFYPPKTYTETLKSWNLIAISLWSKTFLSQNDHLRNL